MAGIALQQANDQTTWADPQRALWQAIAASAIKELKKFTDFIWDIDE